MPTPNATKPPPSLAAFGWALLAVFGFFIGLWHLTNPALKDFPRWCYADRYVAGELEIKRFEHNPRRPSQGYSIDGTIHPSGERALTSTRDLAVRQFVNPAEQAVRRIPHRAGIEGRRMEVWYWTDHLSEYRWWHPPTVIMPGDTLSIAQVIRRGLIGIAFWAVAVFAGRRAWQHVKASARPEPPAGDRSTGSGSHMCSSTWASSGLWLT